MNVCESESWLHSRVQLFVVPWTVACLAPLSMGLSRQEYGSRLHFLLQEILPTQRSNLRLLHWQAGSSPLAPPYTVYIIIILRKKKTFTDCISSLWASNNPELLAQELPSLLYR